MRIVQLDCLAFGPFTNLLLDFGDRPGGLHLVYGPNEAGKSSALRALRQLLYGIPHVSTDNFLHANANLRIGGTFAGPDGQTLTVIRRKGKKNTLRASDDTTVVPLDRLEAMLANVDEGTFQRRFGIDYDELQAGGQAVAEGQGDLGELLFSSGAGLAGLGRIQKQLEMEAGEIFASRATSSRIHRALSALKEARERLQAARLPTAAFVKKDEELSQVKVAAEQLAEQLHRQRIQHHRLTRLDAAMPLIADLHRWQADWDEVRDAAILPEDVGQRRVNLQTEVFHCRHTRERFEQEIVRRDQEIAEMHLSGPLLAAGPEIESLQQLLGSHIKAQRDRSTLEAERASHQRAANQRLSEILGRAATLDDTGWTQLTGAERVRIQNLSVELQRLESRREAVQQQLAAMQEKQLRAQADKNELGPLVEFGELKRAIRQAQQHGDLEQRLVAARQQLGQGEAELAARLRRLTLWAGESEQIEYLAVPSLETIDRFETHFSTEDDALLHILDRKGELEHRQRETELQLAQLTLERDVPTLTDLRKARDERDARWQLVRRRLSGGGTSRSVDGPAAAWQDLESEFERLLFDADRIADRLRSEADRVAAKAALLAAQQQLQLRVAELGELHARALAARQTLDGQWRELWRPLGITPLTPREMRVWVSRQAELAALAAQLRQQRAQIGQLEQLLRCESARLAAALQTVDGSSPSALAATMPLGQRLEQAQEQLDQLIGRQNQRDQLHHQLRQLGDEIPRLQSTLTALESETDGVREQWSDSLERLFLPPQATPAEANEVLRTMELIREHEREAAGLHQRIRAIDSDAEQFRDHVRRLTGRLAPELQGRPPAESLTELYHRLKQVRHCEKLRERAISEREEYRREREGVTAKLEQAEAALQALVTAAGCADVEELPLAEQRSARRQALETQKQRLEEQLGRLAGNESVADFIADAAAQDPDVVRSQLAELQEQIQSLEQRRQELATNRGALENELRQLDGGDRAQRAEEEIQTIVAQLQANVDEYVGLRSAAVVLRRSIERYREKSQGPILQIASARFAELTCGSFAKLEIEYGDQDVPFLVGVRREMGEKVQVDGMSAGTRDQLYLALRLASLEHYLDEHPPVPFIVDDILVQFDNDRAAAALQLLAALSHRTQVIFFTHHSHLIEIAQQCLPSEDLLVHELTCSGADNSSRLTGRVV